VVAHDGSQIYLHPVDKRSSPSATGVVVLENVEQVTFGFRVAGIESDLSVEVPTVQQVLAVELPATRDGVPASFSMPAPHGWRRLSGGEWRRSGTSWHLGNATIARRL
jgi:hypothetical protein